MSDEEKDKQKSLGYQPDIKYQDEYGTDYDGARSSSVSISDTIVDDSFFDNTIMDSIQDNIDEIIFYINGLPVDLQTTVNQVFKPIYLDWNKDFKKHNYPKRIPDTNTPKITVNTGGGGGGGGGGEPPEDDIPPFIIPGVEPKPEPIPPVIWTPEPEAPVIPEPSIAPPVVPPFDDTGDIFAPASPFVVTYEDINEVEKITLEYTKNMADLLKFYTDSLKDTLKSYFMRYASALFSAATTEDVAFIVNNLDSDAVDVNENLRHLIDSTVRSEIMGANKLSFYRNVFTVEKSLYHLKSFATAYKLRLRYTEEEPENSSSKLDTISNNILGTMKDIYTKKYDIAYCDLYKYLNSSVQVLDDAFRTVSVGLKSKETLLLKKGGTE